MNETGLTCPNPLPPRRYTPFPTRAHAHHARDGSHEYEKPEQHRQQFERRVQAERVFHGHVVAVPFGHSRESDELCLLERVIDLVLVIQHQT